MVYCCRWSIRVHPTINTGDIAIAGIHGGVLIVVPPVLYSMSGALYSVNNQACYPFCRRFGPFALLILYWCCFFCIVFLGLLDPLVPRLVGEAYWPTFNHFSRCLDSLLKLFL